MPEPEAAVRSLNQPRHVGDNKAALVAQTDDPEIWRQRRERVVGNFWPRGRDARNQRRLARVRKSDESGIGEQFELQAKIFLFARMAVLCAPRRAIGGCGEVRVSA